jgi:hypothetical protein
MPVLGYLKKKRAPRRKPLRGRSWNAPDFSWMRDPELPECSNTIVYTENRKSFIDALRDESKEVLIAAKLNMNSTAPICNKGAYQFVTKGDDATALGRKK